MGEAKTDDGATQGEGSDQGSAPAPAPLEVRFRNVTSDGRVTFSETLLLAPAVAPPPRLEAPYAAHELYRPGDVATVAVRAEGVRQGAVQFVIEKQAGGAWQTADTLSGTFDAGQAWVKYPVPPLEGVEPVQFRARAVAAFGEETSDPWTVQPPAELSEPEWSHAHPSRGSHFDHGDEAVMRVQAKGLEGKSVAFVVEQQQAGNWAALATVSAVVQGGSATARLVVRHPLLGDKKPTLAELKQAGPLQLRFHCELA